MATHVKPMEIDCRTLTEVIPKDCRGLVAKARTKIKTIELVQIPSKPVAQSAPSVFGTVESQIAGQDLNIAPAAINPTSQVLAKNIARVPTIDKCSVTARVPNQINHGISNAAINQPTQRYPVNSTIGYATVILIRLNSNFR